jgi:PPOX class F420-dependent enzyme/OxyR family protein
MDSTDSQTSTSLFTPKEIAYLKSQRLCRLATVDGKGQPHVTPVAFKYDAETDTFAIGGGQGWFPQSKKWRDVGQNPQVALVFDDIASFDPWTVRGIEIRGVAERRMQGGEQINQGFGPEMFHITPKRIISWGLDTEAYGPPNARSVNEE